MNNSSNKIQGYLTEIIFALIPFSILYSTALTSISLILLSLMAFIEVDHKSPVFIGIRKDIVTNLKNYIKSPPYLALNLLFILVLISGINSENTQELLKHLRMRVPFLFVPFGFFVLGQFDRNRMLRYFYYLFIAMSISAIPVIFNYIFNFDKYNELIRIGQSIPTPIDHIRLSIFLALSVGSGIILWLEGYKIKYKFETNVILFLSVLNFIVVHLLSVRSGVGSMYLILIIIVLKEIPKRSKKIGILTFVFLMLVPIISYSFLPTFKNKINYMIYDLKMYNKGEGKSYSDSERIYSWIVGKEIIKDSPIIGCGIGDLKDQCKIKYHEVFKEKNLTVKYPHNQYIFTFAGCGILGLILFIIGIFVPILYKGNYRDTLFLIFSLTYILSFLVENSLERSYSVAFYLYFTLVSLNYLNRNNTFAASYKQN